MPSKGFDVNRTFAKPPAIDRPAQTESNLGSLGRAPIEKFLVATAGLGSAEPPNATQMSRLPPFGHSSNNGLGGLSLPIDASCPRKVARGTCAHRSLSSTRVLIPETSTAACTLHCGRVNELPTNLAVTRPLTGFWCWKSFARQSDSLTYLIAHSKMTRRWRLRIHSWAKLFPTTES
jgi:hypothetical protein